METILDQITDPAEIETGFERLAHIAAQVPLLSFFSGAGFLDMGFMEAGFEIVWHNEYEQRVVDGFKYGVQSWKRAEYRPLINTHSIVDLEPDQILEEAFPDGLPRNFGMIGGPPCPDFSVGGKNRGHEGEHGRLSRIYVDRIMDLRPLFFLFENVPGLLRTAKHRAHLATLLDRLSVPDDPDAYIVNINILNALDYGVPQDRERVFLVGIQRSWLEKNLHKRFPRVCVQWPDLLNGLAKNHRAVQQAFGYTPWFPWATARRYEDAKTQFRWPRQSSFGADCPRPQGLPDDLIVEPLICHRADMEGLPNSQEGFKPHSGKFVVIPEGDDSGKSFKRLHRWRFSPAAAYGNNEVHLHPTEPRRLTVREALRLQTVPDSYALPPEMPLSFKFKTIGNGVPVNLARAVALGFARVLGGEVDGQSWPDA